MQTSQTQSAWTSSEETRDISIVFGQLLVGDESNNSLSGESTLSSDNPHDIIIGQTGNDSLYGDGNSILHSDDYFYSLLWGGNTETRGNDLLFGGEGDDYLVGSTSFSYQEHHYEDFGIDYLTTTLSDSTSEIDTLTGGEGADTFVLGNSIQSFYEGSGYAVITDFDSAAGDVFEVFGNFEDYSLSSGNWSGSYTDDTLIEFKGDVIGVVTDSSEVVLADDFTFIGNSNTVSYDSFYTYDFSHLQTTEF